MSRGRSGRVSTTTIQGTRGLARKIPVRQDLGIYGQGQMPAWGTDGGVSPRVDADASIRTQELSKSYGSHVVVDSVTLEIRQREIYGLLGPNGAGKTTIIRMILGLLEPSRGRVELFGMSVSKHGAIGRRRIGVVGEQTFLYDDLTALEYLEFFARLFEVENGRQRALQLLDRLGLAQYAHLLARDFSQGMQKKLAVARALLHNPEALVFDEPVSGLDPIGMVLVRELLEEARRAGAGILVSSHILSEVERTADRVGILLRGKLVIEDTVQGIGQRLLPERVLEVELQSPMARVEEMLRGLPGVRGVTRDGSLLSVAFEGDDGIRSSVSRAITDAGGIVVGMSIRKGTLEDAFVRLTKESD